MPEKSGRGAALRPLTGNSAIDAPASKAAHDISRIARRTMPLADEFGAQRDFRSGRQQARNRTIALGVLRLLMKRVLFDARDFGFRRQIDPCDGEAGRYLFEIQ